MTAEGSGGTQFWPPYLLEAPSFSGDLEHWRHIITATWGESAGWFLRSTIKPHLLYEHEQDQGQGTETLETVTHSWPTQLTITNHSCCSQGMCHVPGSTPSSLGGHSGSTHSNLHTAPSQNTFSHGLTCIMDKSCVGYSTSFTFSLYNTYNVEKSLTKWEG